MTVQSDPRLLRKPAHSRATYDAPTIRVLPGCFGSENISSDVMQNSFAPGN
jgi:hypothetical protein